MAGNPAKPKHPSNPVGQTKKIRQARRGWAAHIKPIQAWLLQQFEQIPRQEIASNVGRLHVNRYVYQISVERLNAIVAELVQRLGSGPTKNRWLAFIREAYTQGTAQQVINLQNIAGEQYNRTLAEVLRSDSWLSRIAMIESRVFEYMEGFEGDTAADLSYVLRRGVENGLNPREVAGDIRERFSVSQSRANRIARTEITQAYRRARLDEDADANQRLGIRTGLLHFSALSPTSRQSHMARHGRVFTQEEVRYWYSINGNAINCYLPGTKVRGRFVAGSKALYKGAAVRIVTAGGNDISVTPNHPVMTDRGLIAAAEVTKSDNLVAHQPEIKDLGRVGDLDSKLTDARIEDVFCALMNAGHSLSTGVNAVDFHGDGRFIDEDVEIVDVKRPLVFGGDSASLQFLDDLKLMASDPAIALPHGVSPSPFDGKRLSSDSFVGRLRKLASVLFGRPGMPVIRGRGSPSIFKAGFIKPSIYGNPAGTALSGNLLYRLARHVLPVQFVDVITTPDLSESSNVEAGRFNEPANASGACSDIGSDSLHGLSSFVSLEKVVSVESFEYSGHVYDLQELSGLMVANGLIASNCKCSQASVMLDENGEPVNQKFVNEVRERYTG